MSLYSWIFNTSQQIFLNWCSCFCWCIFVALTIYCAWTETGQANIQLHGNVVGTNLCIFRPTLCRIRNIWPWLEDFQMNIFCDGVVWHGGNESAVLRTGCKICFLSVPCVCDPLFHRNVSVQQVAQILPTFLLFHPSPPQWAKVAWMPQKRLWILSRQEVLVSAPNGRSRLQRGEVRFALIPIVVALRIILS